jgi:hypothetical protein
MIPSRGLTKDKDWLDVPGYEGFYQINRSGIIRGVCRLVVLVNGKLREVPERLIKPRINNRGYLAVRLSRNGETKTKFIHKLLAQAFIPNPDNKPFVNHKNGIKTDIKLENLEWVTHSENIQHAYNTGLISPKGKLIIDKCSGRMFVNIHEASCIYNINPNTLRNYLNGGIKNNPTCLNYHLDALS